MRSERKVVFVFCMIIFTVYGPCLLQAAINESDSATHYLSAQNTPLQAKPGDAIRITFPLDTSSFVNGVYPIDDSGNISLPIVGDYNICSVSMGQLKEYLRKTYEPYLRYPEVQVVPLIRVSLLGGFAKPGMYYIEPQRSMWDLIALAGGTKDEKGLNKMKWERDRKVLQKDLISLIESGRSLRSIGFKSGDQLWTPAEPRRTADVLIRDILPVATFLLSIAVGIGTIRNK